MKRTFLRAGMAVALVLALTGFNPFGLFGKSKPAERTCPAAVILRPLANTALFAPGAAPRPENVAFYGLIDEVDSRCEALQGAVRMHLKVYVIAQRGPAARGNTATFTYFVATTAPGEKILQKQPLTVSVTLPPNKLRAGVTDTFEEVLPLAGYAASALTVDLGFQQSPEVVTFYHHFRGR
jgi:hypothetical protein